MDKKMDDQLRRPKKPKPGAGKKKGSKDKK